MIVKMSVLSKVFRKRVFKNAYELHHAIGEVSRTGLMGFETLGLKNFKSGGKILKKIGQQLVNINTRKELKTTFCSRPTFKYRLKKDPNFSIDYKGYHYSF